MKCRLALLILAAIVGAAVLTGCGGGGGGGGDIELPGVSLSIYADAVGDGTRSVTSRAPVINAPLNDGAVVVANNYMTGAEVDRGTLTAGKCILDVTPGLTIVVVITGTGTEDGKPYRLSTIIANVPAEDTDVVADPATTIAAEAVAQTHPVGNGTVLDDATFDAVLTEATAYVVAHPDDDYSVGGGLIVDAPFGTAGSIVVAEIPDVVAAVPVEIDNNMVLAKNAVQQIKEAGIPLQAMVDQEIPDAEGIFTGAVRDKYEALASRLSDESLLGGVTIYGMNINGEDLDLMEIPLGHTYTLDSDSGSLTETGDGTANQYTITYTYTDGEEVTATLVAVKSGSQWTLTETRSNDDALRYTASFPQVTNGETGANPSLTGSFSFKDKDFPTALTFNGTASAVGSNMHTYTKVVFDGTLASPNFSARGRFEVNFVSSVPAGARPDDTIQDFPTSASMTNANISVTDGAGTTITLTGAMSSTLTIITREGHAWAAPTHFELSGTYDNTHSGLGFKGSITANWTNAAASISDPNIAKGTVNLHGELTRTDYPTYYEDVTVTLNSGAITSDIDLRVGGNRLLGSASGTMVQDNPPYGTLTLTNQAGVQFDLASSASGVLSGTVKAGSPLTQVATIAKAGDRVRITFIDDTFEEF